MISERLGLPESIVHHAAMWRGLQPTKFPDKLAVYLVTRIFAGTRLTSSMNAAATSLI